MYDKIYDDYNLLKLVKFIYNQYSIISLSLNNMFILRYNQLLFHTVILN